MGKLKLGDHFDPREYRRHYREIQASAFSAYVEGSPHFRNATRCPFDGWSMEILLVPKESDVGEDFSKLEYAVVLDERHNFKGELVRKQESDGSVRYDLIAIGR